MRILFLIALLGALLSLCSCGDEPSALDLALEFKESYGIEANIYHPSAHEGESGFVSEGFFESLYGDYSGSVSDFAIILLSDGERISECAVLDCASDHDATLMADAMYDRIELIRSVSDDDACLDGAFVKRRGLIIVMCAVTDNQRAELIWEKILK